MKRHLLLLSAMAMMGTSWAQTSVQIFGVVDMSLAHGSGSISDKTQMSRGGFRANRIGFRGVEDLGGGNSVQLWLEAGFNGDDGTGAPTNTNNQSSGASTGQGLTFNRRSTIGLMGAWGELRLGRDQPPQYLNLLNGDVMALTGVAGTVNFTNIITGVTASRASNMIQYFTPNHLGGIAAHLAHYRGENADDTPNSDDGTGSGVRLTYRKGPFASGIAWSRTKYATGDVLQRNAYASWNFGFATLSTVYSNDRAGTLGAEGANIGVSIPVGAHAFMAAYSWYRRDSVNEPEARKLALRYTYALSKRTLLYSSAARVDNSGGSAVSVLGAVTAPNASSSGIEFGINHRF
ncbi:porin [Massilia niastensis]|uniref:porin n=1 Tax=Massilia niastensis TaxID=544911 RepID=UPI00036D31D2|nr:porin [Massilia niastensis]